ncbi:hypothetical protein CapIbe_002572 [Capra ibex]
MQCDISDHGLQMTAKSQIFQFPSSQTLFYEACSTWGTLQLGISVTGSKNTVQQQRHSLVDCLHYFSRRVSPSHHHCWFHFIY